MKSIIAGIVHNKLLFSRCLPHLNLSFFKYRPTFTPNLPHPYPKFTPPYAQTYPTFILRHPTFTPILPYLSQQLLP